MTVTGSGGKKSDSKEASKKGKSFKAIFSDNSEGDDNDASSIPTLNQIMEDMEAMHGPDCSDEEEPLDEDDPDFTMTITDSKSIALEQKFDLKEDRVKFKHAPIFVADNDKRLQSVESRESNNLAPESCTFEVFRDALKSKKAISERWSVSGVLWDSEQDMRVILVSELDITWDGNMRLKRCVKIFENLKIVVFMDGEDMTERFDVKNILTDLDVTELINTVAMVKVCQGVKNFDVDDKKMFPKVKKRGVNWYSTECGVAVEKGGVGNLCVHCARLRNSIRRKKQKDSTTDSGQSRVPARVVQSPFGKALYSMLNDLLSEGPLPKKKRRRDDMVYNENYQVYLNNEVARKVSDASKAQQVIQIQQSGQNFVLQVPDDGNGDNLRYYPITTSAQGVSASSASSGTPQYLSSEVVQTLVNSNSDGGNIIIQNYGDFSLDEGQEYQVVGEAEHSNQLQVVGAEGSGNIEIIEVDDATMAQLSAQNVLVPQDASTFQVTGLDGSNQGLDHIIKVIN